MAEALIANNLRAERIAAGFDTVEELARRAGIEPSWCALIEDGMVLATREEHERLLTALGGIPANRIYERSWRMLVDTRHGDAEGMAGQVRHWRLWRDESRLLMSREEMNYFDQDPGPDRRADVYVNLSCGTQRSPHLLQDTVSVLEALGVSFVAAAGPSAACCGKPIWMYVKDGAHEQFRQNRLARSIGWGARTHVNWCGACQQTATASAARHELGGSGGHPVRELQLIPFLEERVRELGNDVPWQKEVRRRVLAEGHPGMSNVHSDAQVAIGRLISLIPGLEPVGLYDGWSELSPCAAFGLEGAAPPPWTRQPETPEDQAVHRLRLADEVHALGGDTVACMHQTCHQMWSCYASEELAVVHPVSLLAEALGCAHPDRFQEAVRIADAEVLLEQSRVRWQSWGMSEDRARTAANSICDLVAVAGYTNRDFAGDTDPQSFAMQRRLAVGSACAGGCGGCGGAGHDHA